MFQRRLYDQNQPVTYDDKVYAKRNLGVRRVTSTVLTSTQMGGEPVGEKIQNLKIPQYYLSSYKQQSDGSL